MAQANFDAGDRPAAVDGRSARRLRNTEAAVDAFLALLEEGHPAPTAQLVADHSGLSIRSIFRLFQDMEALHGAAVARQERRFADWFPPIHEEAPVADRITSVVASRAAFYEAVAPVRRHALRVAPTSPQIRDGLARTDGRLRRQLAHVFAPELAAGDGPLLDALDAVTSWDLWDRLRSAQGLPAEAAQRTVALLLTAALRAPAADPPPTSP